MAIIDKLTGYYGFTIDIDPSSPSINSNGEVTTCIVAITFPYNEADVEVIITDGPDDFAVKTGDGQIIPCSNPKVIFVNRDNAIVQFDMRSEYPANSPLTLVYHTDTAGFTVNTLSGTTKPFEVNSVSGHFAFTVEGYKGAEILQEGFDGNHKYVGLVNKVMAVIPFTYSVTSVNARMTDGEDDWGIRMGNGEIIPLIDPQVVTVNQNNFIALLTMKEGYSYPSNSPGILVYRSETAKIEVIPQDDDNSFYPVRNIYDVPEVGLSGTTIDLNCAKVEPFNASIQYIDWSVVSGSAEIVDKHFLHISKGGEIVINGTIENGLGGDDDLNNDYNQSFTISASQNVITKLSDPIPEIKAYIGEINHTIAVVAEATTDHISYQWYKNKSNNYDDAVLITKDGNNAEYVIPTNLEKGDSYFFCEITSDGAAMVRSKICHIYASKRCTSITIYPLDTNMGWESTRQMYIVQYPSDADLPHVNWFSSNDNIASFDEEIDEETGVLKHEGLLRSKFPEIRSDLTKDDTVTITAVTTDILGEQLTATIDIMIESFVPVSDITGLTLNVNPNNSYTLSATVLPVNATNKTIEWTIADDNHSDVYITDGVLTIPASVIPEDHQIGCMIMATIENGSTTHNKYQKEFSVHVTHGFVPVTDIQLMNYTDIMYDSGISIQLNATILPTGSSVKEIRWDLITDNAELHGNTLTFKDGGDVIVRATVPNGAGTVISQSDISKDFTFRCSGSKFVPVDDVKILFSHTKTTKVPDPDNPDGYIESEFTYTDNGVDPDDPYNSNGDITLPITIFPDNTTNKTTVTELISVMRKVKPDNYHDTDYEIPENFWNEGWTNVNNICSLSGDILKVNWEEVTYDNLYQAKIRITISEGLSHEMDFVKEETIQIIAKVVEEFIPLEDIELELPSKLRCMSPLLLEKYNVIPTEASVKNNDTNHIEAPWDTVLEVINDNNGRGGCYAFIIYGDEGEIGFTVDPLPLYQWHLFYHYLYPPTPGKCKLTYTFKNVTVPDLNSYNKYYPKKTNFTKEYELEFLPPFIPVKNIINIQQKIRAKQAYILQGEAYSGDGLDSYNPAWDEEDPTNKDIIYEIIDSTCGATLTNGNIINTTGPGTISLKATISEGVAEYVDWYGIVEPQQPKDFEKTFTIEVLDEEDEFTRDIVTLTLQDDTTVSCTKLGEVLLLCTPDPSDSLITIKDKTFRKDQVIKADFYENIHKELEIDCNGNTESSYEFSINDDTIKLIQNVSDDPFSVEWTLCEWNIEENSELKVHGVEINNFTKKQATINIDFTKLNDEYFSIIYKVTPKNSDGTADTEGVIERNIKFIKVDSRDREWEENPKLRSLCNFGRNFTNLKTINRIPDEITGSWCLMSFLQGCINFNSPIVIPDGVNGNNCLKYFLKDCTSFNSSISIPDTITGNGAMHGFLMGCIHFNKHVSIPSSMKGDRCLKRFMYGCTVFNQPLSIPSGVSGYMCLMECLALCTSFNQPITLPDDVGDIYREDEFYGKVYCGRQLNLMLYEADNFRSNITVPDATALHAEVSERSFSTNNYKSNMISYGITFVGDGAAQLVDKFNNNYERDENGNIPTPVYTHITNIDSI